MQYVIQMVYCINSLISQQLECLNYTCTVSAFEAVIYRLLHGVFDPSPDLSLSRPYQPEPEGRGLILSEVFIIYTYACEKSVK